MIHYFEKTDMKVEVNCNLLLMQTVPDGNGGREVVSIANDLFGT